MWINEMYSEFEKWLDDVLDKDMPIKAEALCFNLYEENDDNWSVQLIGASDFDEYDDVWACDEVYSTNENLYVWKQETEWEEIQDIALDLIARYLNDGRYANDLKEYKALASGFVDGDLVIVYKNH